MTDNKTFKQGDRVIYRNNLDFRGEVVKEMIGRTATVLHDNGGKIGAAVRWDDTKSHDYVSSGNLDLLEDEPVEVETEDFITYWRPKLREFIEAGEHSDYALTGFLYSIITDYDENGEPA